jgi:transcriptional regulator with XRE-family HTH domain
MGRIRHEKEWSQKTLAIEAGVHPNMIQGIESGKHAHPRFSSLEKIFSAMGYEFDLHLTEEPYEPEY